MKRVSVMSRLALVGVFSSFFVLIGCGGGDGGSGGGSTFTPPSISTTPVTIDANNENDVTSTAFESVDDSSDLSGVTNDLFKAGSNADENIVALARKQVQNAMGIAQQRKGFVGAPVVSGTENCMVSGTVAITISTAQDIESQSFTFTAGDYISISASSCNDGDGETTSGTVTITINSSNLTSFTIEFDNFQITDSEGTDTVHGDITMVSSIGLDDIDISSSYSVTISGDSLYVIESGGESAHLSNYDITTTVSNNTYTIAAEFTVDSSEINGRLTVVANLTGTVNSQYPSTGSTIVIQGANGTLSAEVVSSTQVEITLDVDGTPGADPGYPKTVTWEELEGTV